MGILDYFRTEKKSEPPRLVGVSSFDGISVSVDYSIDQYFKMYDKSAYIQMVIMKLMTYVVKDGFSVKKYKKEQEKFLDPLALNSNSLAFVQRIIRDYEIAGNAYVYKSTTESGVFVGFQALDPRYVKPLTDKTGTVLGYIQNLNGISYYLPDEVFHLRGDPDIDNETVGRSKMKTLLIELMTDEEASLSNLAFFKNNQTPSSIIIMDENFKLPDDPQKKAEALGEIKAMFNSGKHNGGANKHRSAFAQGIKEIVKVQDKMSDMEFSELRKFTLDLVCGVYEVPKDILGYTETSNRSVGEEQGANFDDVIQGKKRIIAEFLTLMLQSCIGAEYSFEFKVDEQAQALANIEKAGKAFQSGIAKLNEARKFANLEPDMEKGDEYYQDKKQQDAIEPVKNKVLKIKR